MSERVFYIQICDQGKNEGEEDLLGRFLKWVLGFFSLMTAPHFRFMNNYYDALPYGRNKFGFSSPYGVFGLQYSGVYMQLTTFLPS